MYVEKCQFLYAELREHTLFELGEETLSEALQQSH